MLLLIYLHMIGSLFFFVCLSTYKESSTRIQILDELGMRSQLADGTYTYPFPTYELDYITA